MREGDYDVEKKSDTETLMKLIIGLYILKILQRGPAHGDNLSTKIKQRTQGASTPNINALYPLLRILEERRYIAGKWDSPDTSTIHAKLIFPTKPKPSLYRIVQKYP